KEVRVMATTTLEGTARALVAPGKGILAADESHATIGRRFEPLGIVNNEENRRRYRQMLLTTKGIGEFISGVILFDETIRQKADAISPRGQRGGARAVRRVVPGGGDGSDRRARGADGRRALDRAVLRGYRGHAAHRLPRAVGAQGCAGGHAPETEHGVAGRGVGAPGAGGGRGAGNRTMPAPDGSRCGARDRVPLGWTVGRARDRPPQCDEPSSRGGAVASQLFLRAGTAGCASDGVGRRSDAGGRRAARVPPPRTL